MATYLHTLTPYGTCTDVGGGQFICPFHATVTLDELDIYGSSRLGTYEPAQNLIAKYDAMLGYKEFRVPYYDTVSNIANLTIPETDTFSTHLGQKKYELTDHLGNVLTTISDRKIEVAYDDTLTNFTMPDVVASQDYYAFGMQMPGRIYHSDDYRFGFNGMEQDDDMKGEGNSLNFGARIYDSRLGRWLSMDPLTAEYTYASAYCFALNTPILAKDGDGRRVYFSAGVGHDAGHTGYITSVQNQFQKLGVYFKDIYAHGSTFRDALFTLGAYGRKPYYNTGDYGMNANHQIEARIDWRITSTVDQIKADLSANPLKMDEAFNLMGGSGGSVIIAQAALKMANEGYVIDNLILIGSPIRTDSELYKALKENKNIKNIIYQQVQLEGDKITGLAGAGIGQYIDLIKDFKNLGKNHPHQQITWNKELHEKLAKGMVEGQCIENCEREVEQNSDCGDEKK